MCQRPAERAEGAVVIAEVGNAAGDVASQAQIKCSSIQNANFTATMRGAGRGAG